MGKVPRLAGLAEVASLKGVTRKRAWQITQHPEFPKPVQVLAATPVWLESDVQRFIDTPRAGGRKRKTEQQATTTEGHSRGRLQ